MNTYYAVYCLCSIHYMYNTQSALTLQVRQAGNVND